MAWSMVSSVCATTNSTKYSPQFPGTMECKLGCCGERASVSYEDVFGDVVTECPIASDRVNVDSVARASVGEPRGEDTARVCEDVEVIKKAVAQVAEDNSDKPSHLRRAGTFRWYVVPSLTLYST